MLEGPPHQSRTSQVDLFLNKKIVDLKAQMNEKESLLEDKSNKLVEVGTLLEQKEDQISILQKKRAGEKSGHVRVKRSKIQGTNYSNQ